MSHPGDRVAQAVGVLVSAAASVAVYLGADRRSRARHAARRRARLRARSSPSRGSGRSRRRRCAPSRWASALSSSPCRSRCSRSCARRSATRARDSSSSSLGLAWFADTGAYFAGRFLGRHKLYEAVSPKKTRRGRDRGARGQRGVGALRRRSCTCAARCRSPMLSPSRSSAGALGQAGDLGESLLKRSTGVKDSGAIVPGHGGILDRVDALIVTSIVVYLYALWTR